MNGKKDLREIKIKSRLERERQHGKKLSRLGAESIWNWESPAGQIRAKRRADFFLEYLTPKTHALEIGCGTGIFTRLCASSGASITAVDLSEDLLEHARMKNISSNVTFETADAHALAYNDQQFDVVYGSSILHHLDLKLALKEIFRVLKPGGHIVFAEPNMLNPQIWAERKITFIRNLTNTSKDETAFIRFYLTSDLSSIGFESISVLPYDFLHPSTPKGLIPMVSLFCHFFEKIPFIKEIAGSLVIRSEKLK